MQVFTVVQPNFVPITVPALQMPEKVSFSPVGDVGSYWINLIAEIFQSIVLSVVKYFDKFF